MRTLHILSAVVLATGTSAAHALSISESNGFFELTVPQSRVVLSVPAEGLTQSTNHAGGATESPGYFYFEDRSAGVVLSGWFEPEQRYQSLEESWKGEMKGLKDRGFGEPKAVKRSAVGRWKTIYYEIPLGPEGTSSHIRASCISAGTWVDLHLSVTQEARPNVTKGRVMRLLESLKVDEKK